MTMDAKPTVSSQDVNGSRNGLHSPSDVPASSALGEAATQGAGNGNLSSTLSYRGMNYRLSQPPALATESLVITRRSRVPLAQWFYNLPVRNKQLIGLISSQVISVAGLVGVGAWLLISSGNRQLEQQAKSELAVMNIEYNIKINQMGFGFRGQSDNPAIIELAAAHAADRYLSDFQLESAREILEREISARNIEYATLVGKDGTIIVNANADRAGQPFDPGGLVSRVLNDPRQVKASALVTWQELKTEAPPLPEGFANEDALIRYTITPVFSRETETETEELVGVLVSGDIVNRKLPIVEETIAAFNSGYSAIYLQDEAGDWQLLTSADQDVGESQLESFEPIYDTQILDQAIAGDGNVVTSVVRETVGEDVGLGYTMAAQSIEDISGQPIGVLVRGTSRANLTQLINDSLARQGLVAALVVLANILLAQLLGRSLAKPLKQLQLATERFAAGDRRARSEIYSRDEVGQVANAFNQLATTVSQAESYLMDQTDTQTKVAQRARLLAELTSRIRQSLEVEQILTTSVDGVREVLQVDRVLIYRFDKGYASGVISAESVDRGWLRARGETINDPLTPESIRRFETGQTSYIEDLDRAKLTACHCEILERLEVKANMVAPILVGDTLMGLLCAHQCGQPRQWTQEELDLMQQLATQVGYALGQAMLLLQQRQTVQRERQLADLVTRMRESLDREKIFRTVVHETRDAIATDRVIVFMFDETWKGTIIAESVDPDWPSMLKSEIADPCFADRYVEQYRQGRIKATQNIYEADLTPCHLGQLEPFMVKANLVTPIVVADRLLGLLIAHECRDPREWSELDISFVRQAALQLGFTLEQVDLFNQREQARLSAESLSEERRQRQETLQMQLLALLEDVEGAASGDLTVRADVTAGEIGTVADFFNSIVENLRQIVTQVKTSATRVNTSLGDNEVAIRTLAEDALQQAEQTTQTLNSVEQMTQSIARMADQAQQAAQVARSASETAEAGGAAMDLTVQNILDLRETVGETAKKVKRLGESSQQISKVVSLINQIAMQTNLLAINAGIEAARAGEEGQGFAAVAEEVGDLATRSAAATQEIERIVDNIQRETSDVVEAIEQSTAQVVEGTHRVEGAKQSLTQILEVSRQINELAQSISEATVSQVQTAATVSTLMQEIAVVSERASHSSRGVSEAIRETVSVAQALESSMATFKVDSHH